MKVEMVQTDSSFANIDLDPDSIHIFSLDIEAIYDSKESLYQNILSSDEIEKADRFFHIRDRANFLVRRYYLRVLLSKLLCKSPGDLRFGTMGNKKPVIFGREFNISHSGQYAVIAISSKPVGIDIENISDSFQYEEVAARCFNGEELICLKDQNTTFDFFRLWTRKEAILKATGEGLGDNLHLLNCMPNRVFRNGQFYELTSFTPEPDYVVSVASAPAASKIQYWRVAP